MGARVVVLGSSNMDLVLRGERLPAPGETILGTEYLEAFGGKGANQAVAAARAGAEVELIAAVGADEFGRRAADHYRREGLGIEHIKIVEGRPSGVALILVDARGENMISVHPGANAWLGAGDVEGLPEEVFTRGGVFVTQFETPPEAVEAGLERARAAGMLTVLNPAPAGARSEREKSTAMADLIVPNEGEAARLTGTEVRDREGAERAALALLQRGARAAIVTIGEKGSLVAATDGGRGRTAHVAALEVTALDTVGAGDAFVGALAARLAEQRREDALGWDNLIEAARWATHAAAISVTRMGAQPSLPSREEIERSYGRTEPPSARQSSD